MPPKRQAPPKSVHLNKLNLSKELEPAIRSIVCHIMFTAGDSENPFPENENLVVDLLKNELVLLFEDVLEVYDHQIQQIKLDDLFSILRSQHSLLATFQKYLRIRVEMASFMKNSKKEMESDEEDGEDKEAIDEVGDVDGEEGEYLRKRRKGTVDEMLLEEVTMALRGLEVKKALDEEVSPRDVALQTVIWNMSSEQYTEFANARRTSFQTHSPVVHAPVEFTRKKKKGGASNNRVTLLSWLGEPPIHGEAALVFVAFLAKEVVSEVVGAALLERFTTNPSETGALREQYYEEALRKNQRFRKYGRLFV